MSTRKDPESISFMFRNHHNKAIKTAAQKIDLLFNELDALDSYEEGLGYDIGIYISSMINSTQSEKQIHDIVQTISVDRLEWLQRQTSNRLSEYTKIKTKTQLEIEKNLNLIKKIDHDAFKRKKINAKKG